MLLKVTVGILHFFPEEEYSHFLSSSPEKPVLRETTQKIQSKRQITDLTYLM